MYDRFYYTLLIFFPLQVSSLMLIVPRFILYLYMHDKGYDVYTYTHTRREKLCESLDANATYLSRSSGRNPSSKSPLEFAFLFLSFFLPSSSVYSLFSLSLSLVFLPTSLVVTTVPYLSHNGPCSFRLCVALSDELEKIDSGERMKLKAKF